MSRRRKRRPNNPSTPPGWEIRQYMMFDHYPRWQCAKVVDGKTYGMWGLESKSQAREVARECEKEIMRYRRAKNRARTQ